jgi:hypothetical protein
MPTITQWLDRGTLSVEAGRTIHAGVKENFEDVEGGHKCKLCGALVKHPRAAAAHLAVHHRKALEANKTFGQKLTTPSSEDFVTKKYKMKLP